MEVMKLEVIKVWIFHFLLTVSVTSNKWMIHRA